MPFRLTASWFTLRAYCPSAQPFPFTRPSKLNDVTEYDQVVIRTRLVVLRQPKIKNRSPRHLWTPVDFSLKRQADQVRNFRRVMHDQMQGSTFS
jgi:hypothetical protein